MPPLSTLGPIALVALIILAIDQYQAWRRYQRWQTRRQFQRATWSDRVWRWLGQRGRTMDRKWGRDLLP